MEQVVDVLFRPWSVRPPRLSGARRVLFLGARMHPDLVDLAPCHLHLVQPFKPWFDELETLLPTLQLAGAKATRATDDRDVGEGYAAALVLPDRQREAAQAWLGRAWGALEVGGELVAAAPNREGGKRLADTVAELAGVVSEETKHRCRVVRATKRSADADGLAATWAELDAPRPVIDGTLSSRPGLFGWDRVDPGTAMLARLMPTTLGGVVVDAGAGHGWLGSRVLARCPAVTTLHLLEADARALAIAQANLAGARVPVTGHWCDASQTWPVRGVDVVVCNPPFHEGGRADPAIGQAFLQRAAAALRAGGRAWIVANAHLPYERTLRVAFAKVRTVEERGGYKVFEAEAG